MVETFDIAGYCRISVDDELDRDNTSIENQKSIIKEYVERTFPGSRLTFYEDRDRSGYTFEQREGYQKMRPYLMGRKYDILVVKDFSRFSRRNSRGLVELEDLRDAGVRIISIGDSIDYPTYDDWTAIQFRFLVNEMPVTDASKKVKSVIKRRQEDGKWICAVPYGYVITNYKTMTYEVEPTEALVVKKVFELYSEGWGYKKIANYLTEQHYPTPRMNERARKEARGEECKLKARPEWSIVTVQGMLTNDFYIGTLRQGKYTRKKINGDDIKKDESEHIVFENYHEAIIDYRTFATVQEQLKKRTTNHYRGVKKYDNVYSGIMVCGDCGSPMFPMSRKDLKDAYRCGAYHQRGLKGCTSHHIRVDVLDNLLRNYLIEVRETSSEMIAKLKKSIEGENDAVKNNQETIDILEKQLEDAHEEKKMYIRQCTREIMRRPEREETIQETYDELIAECEARIDGINNQILLTHDKRNTIIKVNRITKVALDIFEEIISKSGFQKGDLELIVEKIYVYEDHIEIKLKADITSILESGTIPETEEAANFSDGIIDSLKTVVVQTSTNRLDKVYDVSVISNGDPLEIYTASDGEVIFKKYSPIGELSEFASQYTDVLYRATSLPVIITDRDHVIAVSGMPKKDAMDKRISAALEELISERGNYVASPDAKALYPMAESDREAGIAFPIIGGGDVSGAVVLMLGQSGSMPTQTEIKLVSVAASFLGKQTEE
ncbi:MAG: recombinase family protein [Oscillospiraceae bacterium]|nr:recombinase family protein [Oscillospiraceae bacterium]